MMSGHIKGPWRAKSAVTVVGPAWHARYDGEEATYEKCIATVQPVSAQMGGEPARYDTALLIAAAPDLYHAAEVAHTVIGSMTERTVEEQQAFEWLTDALARARGAA